MKKLKAIISILICLIVVFSSTVTSGAVSADKNPITYDEFCRIVTSAFAAEGKEIIVEYDENHVYTQHEIDAMIELLENDNVVVEVVDGVTKSNSVRLMPATFDGMKSVSVTSIVGHAVFKLNFSGTLDLQGNNIMSVDSLNIDYFGGVNYYNHSLTADWERKTTSSNTTRFYVTIDGYVFFRGSLLGVNYSIKEPVSKVLLIDALDYI